MSDIYFIVFKKCRSLCLVFNSWYSTLSFSLTCDLLLLFSRTTSVVVCLQRLTFPAAPLTLDLLHLTQRTVISCAIGFVSGFPIIYIFSTSKPGEELDWDEEFALQDFLKSELEERNCREKRGGQTDGNHRKVVDNSTGSLGEEKEEEEKADSGGGSEERWMVVDTAGEAEGEGEARATSTPVSALPGVTQPGNGEARGGQGELGNSQLTQHHCNCSVT